MSTLNKYLYLALGLGLLAGYVYISYINNSRDNALKGLDLANKKIEILGSQIEKYKKDQKTINDLDKDYQEKLRNAKSDNDKLLSDLNNANKRLYVKVKCPVLSTNTATTSSIDATTRAELDRENAKRIIRVTQDGDNAIMQLSALQKYVNEVCLKN